MGEPTERQREQDRDVHAASWGLRFVDESGRPLSEPADHPAADPAEPWPENARVAQLFGACANRWSVGASGGAGLDLMSCLVVAQAIGINRRRFDDLLTDFLYMEDQALIYTAERGDPSLKTRTLH